MTLWPLLLYGITWHRMTAGYQQFSSAYLSHLQSQAVQVTYQMTKHLNYVVTEAWNFSSLTDRFTWKFITKWIMQIFCKWRSICWEVWPSRMSNWTQDNPKNRRSINTINTVSQFPIRGSASGEKGCFIQKDWLSFKKRWEHSWIHSKY